MEQHRRRTLEQARLETLTSIRDVLMQTPFKATLEESELESFGVLRWTNLDVDTKSPCDFEPRFFSPCYDETSELEEEGNRLQGVWGESLDSDKDINSDCEWVQNVRIAYPEFREGWFTTVLHCLSLAWEGEDTHPMLPSTSAASTLQLTLQSRNAYTTPYHDDLGFAVPSRWKCNDLMYQAGNVYVPAATTDNPHMGIIMHDVTVAPEDKMLRSELDAAVSLLREQVGSGRYTDHHTKPVLVCTFQSETHARITQVHLDAKLNKLVVRQSRLLDLRGKEPTPDAWILLRWLVNTPVGTTRYEDVEDGEVPDGHDKLAAEQPVLVEVESG